MKKFVLISMLLLAITCMVIVGCSGRVDTPLIDADSTLVYPAKDAAGLMAKITLFSKEGRFTGDPLDVGTEFIIEEDANVKAFIDLKNRFVYGERELIFHIDWIGSDGQSLYRKIIMLPRGDSSSTINSSISISPEKREPGTYSLRIYFFRELIIEKEFHLFSEWDDFSVKPDAIKAKVTLCRTTGKKTGKRIGVDSVFTIKEKANVRAFVDLEDRFVFGDRELMFHLDWIGINGKSFYRKQINLLPDDSTSTINSSISITPGKREPGIYFFRTYLFEELILEKKIELLEESSTSNR